MAKYAGFSSTQLVRPKRSDFDLSWTHKTTTRMGRLTPIYIEEAIPSDTFRGSSEVLLRLAPLLAPIYDEISLYVHFFFVPNRLLWAEWEEFITGGRLGVGVDPDVAPVPPFCDIGKTLDSSPSAFAESSLMNYLGVPVFAELTGGDYDGKTIDMMPALAYQLVWLEYYRDRNFYSDDWLGIEFPVPSGEIEWDTYPDLFDLQKRAWEHDYFTSALPFTQRGVEVLMPLAGTGSVTYLNSSNYFTEDGSPLTAGAAMFAGNKLVDTGVPADATRVENIDEVNLDTSSVSINDFRSSYALQVWLERNAVGGSRYNESTLAHFGVKPQDSRLQRPEYIGGGKINVNIREVVSTAYSEDADAAVVPLGNLGGHGVTYGNTNQFSYFCSEHGFIIGIASIMSPPSYYQGLPRMFRRRSFLDYPWPTFAKLGEQQVDKAELYASATNLTEDSNGILPLFGYQSRYADWKYHPNRVSGAFQSTLKFWTLVRDFANSPVLGRNFVDYDQTLQNRIFAVTDESADNFWLYVYNNVRVRRPLPYFGQPNTLGFS